MYEAHEQALRPERLLALSRDREPNQGAHDVIRKRRRRSHRLTGNRKRRDSVACRNQPILAMISAASLPSRSAYTRVTSALA